VARKKNRGNREKLPAARGWQNGRMAKGPTVKKRGGISLSSHIDAVERGETSLGGREGCVSVRGGNYESVGGSNRKASRRLREEKHSLASTKKKRVCMPGGMHAGESSKA